MSALSQLTAALRQGRARLRRALAESQASAAPGPARKDGEDAGAATDPGLVVTLWVTQGSWVRRRVESVRWHDEQVIRRRVSLDLGLSRAVTDARLIPLTLLQKQPLLDFDITDGMGTPCSVLTAAENSRVMADGMLAWLELILGRPVPAAVREATGALIATRDSRQGRTSLRRVEAALRGPNAPAELDPWLSYLAELVENFVLVAEVPPDPARRTMFKFSYDDTAEPVELERSWSSRWSSLAGRRTYEVPTIGAAHGGSFHIEGFLPDDVAWDHAALAGDDAWEEVDNALPRLHAHVYGSQFSPATLIFDLRARPRRASYAARIIAGLTALVAVVGASMLGDWFDAPALWPSLSWLDLSATEEGTQSAGLLLSLAGVAGTLVVSQPEHHLRRRLLRAPRWLMALAPVLIFVLAGTLLVEMSATVRAVWWSSVALVAFVDVLLLSRLK